MPTSWTFDSIDADVQVGTAAAEELIDRIIQLHPHRPGIDNAWLPRYGYAVWILVDALNAADGDVGRVARA